MYFDARLNLPLKLLNDYSNLLFSITIFYQGIYMSTTIFFGPTIAILLKEAPLPTQGKLSGMFQYGALACFVSRP
jgi:hypothetical protein